MRMLEAPGSVRGVAPVASTSRPYSTVSPLASVTVCAPVSSAVTSVPVRTSTFCSCHHSAGCMYTSAAGFSPRRNSLVSGGR